MEEHEEQYKISIKNTGGVPVLEVAGALNRKALSAVEQLIGSLASAGHYNIVLNVRNVTAASTEMIGKLSKAAESVLRHYGAIDVVAEAALISRMAAVSGLARLFRFCTSENEAIRRIKRLSRSPEATEPSCSARIMEAK